MDSRNEVILLYAPHQIDCRGRLSRYKLRKAGMV